jgi:hypothetical protein
MTGSRCALAEEFHHANLGIDAHSLPPKVPKPPG